MTRHLIVTGAALRQWLDALAVGRATAVLCPAGLSTLPDRLDWLVARAGQPPPGPDPAVPRAGVVRVREANALPSALAAEMYRCPVGGFSSLLALGVGNAAGHLVGLCRTPRGFEPLDSVTIVGAGLPQVFFQAHGEGVNGHPRPGSLPFDPSSGPLAIWSRTIGALGERTWRRLCSLRVAVVGCGRSGSLVATSLLRFGVRHLTLIDPDTLEAHNCGEMDGMGLHQVGELKAQAVADSLGQQGAWPDSQLAVVPDSVLSLSALVAVKAADVLFCCVDNATARLATAFLAALYLKPLFDVGTGILQEGADDRTGRRMGADMRLVLPGRCLLCLGGVAGAEAALASLFAGGGEQAPWRAGQVNWRQQRAGSLRSLNGLAVQFALRLLEDFIGGRVAESVWLHVEFNGAGIPTLEHRTPPPDLRCRLCALAGSGDEGVPALRALSA
jgi:hypothetical protein